MFASEPVTNDCLRPTVATHVGQSTESEIATHKLLPIIEPLLALISQPVCRHSGIITWHHLYQSFAGKYVRSFNDVEPLIRGLS